MDNELGGRLKQLLWILPTTKHVTSWLIGSNTVQTGCLIKVNIDLIYSKNSSNTQFKKLKSALVYNAETNTVILPSLETKTMCSVVQCIFGIPVSDQNNEAR